MFGAGAALAAGVAAFTGNRAFRRAQAPGVDIIACPSSELSTLHAHVALLEQQLSASRAVCDAKDASLAAQSQHIASLLSEVSCLRSQLHVAQALVQSHTKLLAQQLHTSSRALGKAQAQAAAAAAVTKATLTSWAAATDRAHSSRDAARPQQPATRQEEKPAAGAEQQQQQQKQQQQGEEEQEEVPQPATPTRASHGRQLQHFDSSSSSSSTPSPSPSPSPPPASSPAPSSPAQPWPLPAPPASLAAYSLLPAARKPRSLWSKSEWLATPEVGACVEAAAAELPGRPCYSAADLRTVAGGLLVARSTGLRGSSAAVKDRLATCCDKITRTGLACSYGNMCAPTVEEQQLLACTSAEEVRAVLAALPLLARRGLGDALHISRSELGGSEQLYEITVLLAMVAQEHKQQQQQQQ